MTPLSSRVFFFNDTATTEIYTLSLHDALPICAEAKTGLASWYGPGFEGLPTASGEPYDPHGYTAAHKTMPLGTDLVVKDRKSTRLNSSHANISYAGFCLIKKLSARPRHL